MAELHRMGRAAAWSTLVMLAVITTGVCLACAALGFLAGWRPGLALAAVLAAVIPWWALAARMIEADRRRGN